MNDGTFGLKRLILQLKEKNKLIVVAAALLLGLALIFLSGDGGEKSREYDFYGIAAELEGRVEKLCGEVQGVSRVSVMITLDSVGETRYARNTQTSKDAESVNERSEYVTASGGLLPISEVAPRVRGVAVVCGGGGRSEVQLKLTELICALFDIPASSVSIIEGK